MEGIVTVVATSHGCVYNTSCMHIGFCNIDINFYSVNSYIVHVHAVQAVVIVRIRDRCRVVVARINYIATATAVLLSLFIHFPNSYVTIYVPGKVVTNHLNFAV